MNYIHTINNAVKAYIQWKNDPIEILNNFLLTCKNNDEELSTCCYLYLLHYVSSNKLPKIENKYMCILHERIEKLRGTSLQKNNDVDHMSVINHLVFQMMKSMVDGYNILVINCELILTDYNFSKNVQYEMNQHIFLLKIAHDCYFYLGESQKMLTSLIKWNNMYLENKDHPFHSYYLGMLSFALEENNHYNSAEYFSKKALLLDKHDVWSQHALSHVYEMTGRHNEGLERMNTDMENWIDSQGLVCHNTWHVALFHLENLDIVQAHDLLRNNILPKALESKMLLDWVDAISLCWRIFILIDNPIIFSIEEKTRFNPKFYETIQNIKNYLEKTDELKEGFATTAFNNFHFQMFQMLHNTILGFTPKREHLKFWFCMDVSEKTVDTLTKSLVVLHNYLICRQMYIQNEYHECSYSSKTEDFVRNFTKPLGGSNAQRDILWQTFLLTGFFYKDKNCLEKKEISEYLLLLNERILLKPKSKFLNILKINVL